MSNDVTSPKHSVYIPETKASSWEQKQNNDERNKQS